MVEGIRSPATLHLQSAGMRTIQSESIAFRECITAESLPTARPAPQLF